MITTKEAAALVQGAASADPKVARLTVARAFYLAGKPQKVGAVVEVAEAFARELISYGKAVRHVHKPAAPRPADEKPVDNKVEAPQGEKSEKEKQR